MQPSRLIILSALLISVFLRAQDEEGKRKGAGPEDLPTSSLISKPGPSFVVSPAEIEKQTKVIVYGDQRFTDPTNTKVTNPKVRRLLVQKIAEEHPDAILMNGDVPYSGDIVDDYNVSRQRQRYGGTTTSVSIPRLAIMNFTEILRKHLSTGGTPSRRCVAADGTRFNWGRRSTPLHSTATPL
jgi:hypothetical protein